MNQLMKTLVVSTQKLTKTKNAQTSMKVLEANEDSKVAETKFTTATDQIEEEEVEMVAREAVGRRP